MEEEFAAGIENQNMHGAMFESLAMNFAAGKLANNLVAIVYNIENFVLHNSSYCDGSEGAIVLFRLAGVSWLV